MSPLSPELILEDNAFGDDYLELNRNLATRGYLPKEWFETSAFTAESRVALYDLRQNRGLYNEPPNYLGVETFIALQRSWCSLTPVTTLQRDSGQVKTYTAPLSHWQNKHINYRVSRLPIRNGYTYDHAMQAIRNAFAWWQNSITGITFNEVPPNNPNGLPIVIEIDTFPPPTHPPLDPQLDQVDFTIHVPGRYPLAHAFYPVYEADEWACDIHFNDDPQIPWAVGDMPGFDLETMAMHEIGHALGLEHSRNLASIMYEDYIGKYKNRREDGHERLADLYALGSSNTPITYDSATGPGGGGSGSHEGK